MHTRTLCLAFALIATVASTTAVRSQVRLVEDFPYDAGDTLTSCGWATNQSTVTSAVLVTEPGLSYPQHPGSGLGNAAQLGPSGQDVYREFESSTDGSLYLFCMINVQQASSGDYILHFQPSPQSTSFFGRLFIREAVNGQLSFGIAKRGTNASPTYVYSDSLYGLETTYGLVVKYAFKSGSNTDDEASLFIFDGAPLPSVEPALPTVGPVTDATNDAPSLSVVTLRQGDASHGPTLTIDGLRICSSWDACLPVSIQTFAAEGIGQGRVALTWTTTTEVNCYGFTIQRAAGDPELLADLPGAFIPGRGTNLLPTTYSYIDTVISGGRWYYRLRQSDLDGSSHFSETVVVELPTSVNEAPSGRLLVEPNFPNPFNSETTIRFSVPVRARVSVEVYNAIGENMRRLVNDVLEPGEYRLSIDAGEWPGGVYFCRIRAAGIERVTRMVLLR